MSARARASLPWLLLFTLGSLTVVNWPSMDGQAAGGGDATAQIEASQPKGQSAELSSLRKELSAARETLALCKRSVAEANRTGAQQHEVITATEEDLECLLRQIIDRDVPRLKDADLGDWEKSNLLRNWAAQNVDFCIGRDALLDYDKADFYRKSVARLMADFFNDKGGVWCGGIAFMLMHLCEMYGLPAYYAMYGWPDGPLTHSVTLVEIEHEHRRMLVAQDAYVDITYVDADGNPLDIRDMLRALKRRDHGAIRIMQGVGGPRDVLVAAGRNPLSSWAAYNDPDSFLRPIVVLPDGRRKYRTKLTLGKMQHGWGGTEAVHKRLEEQGLPPDLLYLWLYLRDIKRGLIDAEGYLEDVKAIIDGSSTELQGLP